MTINFHGETIALETIAMPSPNGIETGRPHIEDTSIARDLIPAVKDNKGKVLVYDLTPTPQPSQRTEASPNVFYSVDEFLGKDLVHDRVIRPQIKRRGFVGNLRLAGASILAGMGR